MYGILKDFSIPIVKKKNPQLRQKLTTKSNQVRIRKQVYINAYSWEIFGIHKGLTQAHFAA